MFELASVSSYEGGRLCFNGDPFLTLARETRGDAMKEIQRDEGSTLPYIAIPRTSSR